MKSGLKPSGKMLLSVAVSAVMLLRNGAPGCEFESVAVAGQKFIVCKVDMKKDHLALFLNDDAGNRLKTFTALDAWLAKSGRKLVFAMNAGMFHQDRSPVGLFVADGKQLAPINLADGTGNFYLKPNGVFALTASGAHIVASPDYAKLAGVTLATQSGPLLVQAGRIHAAFNAKSDSRLYRNGVGITADGTVLFAISDTPVNLYEFAALFRDTLHCPDALFFDGTVSSLFAPQLHRNDYHTDLGPMIGVVE